MLRSKMEWQSGPQFAQAPFPPMPFIVGTGRCGTTLLRMMLDAHPDLAIPPETHFIPALARAFQDPSKQLDDFLELVVSFHTWQDFGIDVGALREALSSPGPFSLTHALRTFYRLYAEKFGKPRWGDKTPMYFADMSLVQRLIPEARFIHLIRDGRDVALSIKDLWFGPNSIHEVAGWWVSRINQARNQVDALPWYIEVRYEDLVRDTEDVLRRICAFIDVPWNPIVLDYHERAAERLAELRRDAPTHDRSGILRAEDRVGIFSLVLKPPQADRLERWRTEMTRADREWFEGVAGATLRELGYEVG
jgi:Sulfotransferase family